MSLLHYFFLLIACTCIINVLEEWSGWVGLLFTSPHLFGVVSGMFLVPRGCLVGEHRLNSVPAARVGAEELQGAGRAAA